MSFGEIMTLGLMCFYMLCLAVWFTVEFWSYEDKVVLIMIDGTVLAVLLGIAVTVFGG